VGIFAANDGSNGETFTAGSVMAFSIANKHYLAPQQQLAASAIGNTTIQLICITSCLTIDLNQECGCGKPPSPWTDFRLVGIAVFAKVNSLAMLQGENRAVLIAINADTGSLVMFGGKS
jgi:hypothetical protein